MRRLFEVLIAGSAFGLLVASLVLLPGFSFPLIEVFANLRPHMLAAAAAVLVVALVLHRPSAVMALIALVALTPATLPYLLTGSVNTVDPDSRQVSVLQFNTLYSNDDIDAMVEEILESDADIVALHEMTDERWRLISPQIESTYPYDLNGLDLPLEDARGFASMLLSRSPIREAALPETDISPVAGLTMIDDQEVLVIALHPSPSRTNAVRIAQRRELLSSSRRLTERHDGPAIIATDLNITPTSPDYQDFVEALGWPDPRRQLGITPTFPAGPLNVLGIAIDHVFASPEFTIVDYELGSGGGSDHRSLLARLAL